MNLKNLLTRLATLVVMLTFLSGSALAAEWYVNQTNGDDGVGDGSAGNPYRSITKALSVAANSGDIIYVAAGVYTNAIEGGQVGITKSVTIIGVTNAAAPAQTQITIDDGILVNPGAAGTVNLGRASDNSLVFNLGNGTPANALSLTSGSLVITGTNVNIANGGTITRVGGSISETPNTTNVFLVYNGGTLNAGPEVPASLGVGDLTVNTGAVTFANAIAFTGTNPANAGTVIVNGTADATFNSGLVFNYGGAGVGNYVVNPVDNLGTGDVVVNGNIEVNETGTGNTAIIATFNNNAGGTLTLNGHSISGTTTVGLADVAAGVVSINGGVFNGAVNNSVGGLINLAGNTSFTGAVTNPGTIRLNGNTLTLAGVAQVVNNTGNIVSVAAGTVGGGTLSVNGGVTLNGGGNVPNVSIAGSGSLILGANTQIDGNYDQNSTAAPALTDGGFIMTVLGNWTRHTSNPADVLLTGTLAFTATPQQTWTPGAGLTVNNVTVNKAGIGVGDLVMGSTVEVAGAFNITAGRVNLGNYNIRLVGVGAAAFTNGGSFYTSTGAGYLIIEGTNKTLTGAGTFGNTDIRVGNGNVVTLGSNINLSGVLIFRSGGLNANTLTLTNANVAVPEVRRNVDATQGAGFGTTGMAVAAGVSYDLTYFGVNAGANNLAAGVEMQAAGIRHLSQNATTAAGTDVQHGVAVVVTGNITVAPGQLLTNGAGLTSTGDATHSIRGTLVSDLLLQGAVVTVNGAVAATDAATITGNFNFDPQANNGSLTSNGLKTITGNVNILPTTATTGAVANITMNGTTSIITGNVVVGTAAAATLNLSLPAGGAGATNTHTGNITLTAGAMTYTRGATAALRILTGNVVLTAGTFTLGSHVTVTGTTTQTTAAMVLDGFNYNMQGNYTRNGAGAITSTGGYLVVNNGGAALFTPGANFTVPYLMINNGAGNAVNLAGNINVSVELWQFTGDIIDGGNNITIQGDYNYATGTGAVAGTYTGTGTLIFAGSAVTAGANLTVPNIQINSNGTAFFKTDDVTVPITYRTFSTSTFTQTKGNVDIDGNTLVVTGETTPAVDFSRGANAGSWSMTAVGSLQFNDATGLTFTPGTGWSVDNLVVGNAAGAVNNTNSSFTVNRALTLAGPLNVSTSATVGNMNFADGATLTRQANGATLTKRPNYLGMVNLAYTVAGAITTALEIPTTDIINNFTVSAAGGIVLAHNIIVNGTFVAATLTDATTNNRTVTMADGSSLQLNNDGNIVFDKLLVKAGIMHLIYNGAANTSNFELGNPTFGVHPQYNGNITVRANVDLNTGNLTHNGTLTFNGGNLALTNTYTALGDVVSTATAGGGNGGFFGAGTAVFGGSANTVLNVGGYNTASNPNKRLPAGLTLRMLKSNNEAYVTLQNGNLDFAFNNAGLTLTNGVLVTGTNVVILRHTDDGLGNPTQGFVRNPGAGQASHIVGNVRKLIDVVGVWGGTPAVALTRVEFPVGTMPASAPNYRPMAFQFNTLPTANFSLTVNHVEGDPQGSNGFPIQTDGLTITNYPDFYWLVQSTLTLQPQVKYDIEAAAAGYTDYQEDGIQNVRFIRRFDNNVNNPWLVQGGLGYDNSTDGTTPVVIVRNGEGAVSTQGARFTYSQLSKPPVITRDVASPAVINEGDTLTVNYTATDPDVGETATLSAVSIPDGASFASGVLTWITGATDAGNYTAIMKATSTSNEVTHDTLAITVLDVNQPPVITNLPADTVTAKAGVEFAYTFEASDPDPDNTGFTWALAAAPAGAAIDGGTGEFTWTPDSSLIGQYFDVSVRVYDSVGDSTDGLFTLWVFQNQGPVFVQTVPRDTVFVGDTAEITYEAEDPNMDPLTFSFYDEYPDGAELITDGNKVTFKWTPVLNQTAVYLIRIAVSDGELSDSTQTELLVKATTSEISGKVAYNNAGAAGIEDATVSAGAASDDTDADGNYLISGLAPGTYNVSATKSGDTGGLSAADALKAARFAAGLDTSLNELAQAAADVNNSGSVTAADAQLILQKVVDPAGVTFAKGDWVFSSESVDLGSTSKVVNLSGQVVGDVNASYVPGALLTKDGKEANSVTALGTENVKIKAEEEFEVPINYSGRLETGAITLQFSYPVDKMEFISVKAPVNFVYKDVDGVITLAWADLTGKNSLVLEDSPMLILGFKATDKFSKDEIVYLTLEEKSEITDVEGKVLKSSQISVPGIEQSVPREFALSQNYPNPFNPSTVINYDLPENGAVKLVVYNMLGEEVTRLVDTKQEAGSYKVQWNAHNFASGVYVYRITVEGVKNFVQTKKMMLIK